MKKPVPLSISRISLLLASEELKHCRSIHWSPKKL